MPASKTNPETAVGAMYRLSLGNMLGVAVGISCMLWIFEGNVASASDQLPNIVYVLCDDLGYGDVQCLVPNTSKIPTPNADQLAAEGMVFTDAHSGSSVCTPTRYGLLTGRYSWRTRLQKGVVTGFAPCLIDASRPTIGKFLTDCGTTLRSSASGISTSNTSILKPESNTNRRTTKRHRSGLLFRTVRFTAGSSISTAFIMAEHGGRDCE